MFFSEEHISESEKIDHIYRMLRAEQRGWIFKSVIKLLILGFIIYGYFYITNPVNEEIRTKIMSTVEMRLTKIILPMVNNMVQNMTQNMQVSVPEVRTPQNTSNNTHKNIQSTPAVNITPEMIKAVQDSMKK